MTTTQFRTRSNQLDGDLQPGGYQRFPVTSTNTLFALVINSFAPAKALFTPANNVFILMTQLTCRQLTSAFAPANNLFAYAIDVFMSVSQ